ncbi:MAG: MmgE/PrpD family protein [Pseudomonas sp.]
MLKNHNPAPGVASDPAGPTGQLATWLAGFSLDAVPAAIIERAKLLLLDGIGCAIVGAKLPWSVTAVQAVAALEGDGPCQVIGWGRSLPAPAAALLNGTFIQGFELDDFHPLAPLHSASLLLPALLACADKQGRVSGKRFLEGAIAGCEVGPRVGLALHGGQMLSRGWHSGPVFGTHASAAATGVLLGLDASGFENALGLAATQSAGLMAAQYEAMSKRMHHGMSSRNGLYAAYLAASGYTGIQRVYEREYGGFLSTFGEGHAPDATQIAQGLGSVWQTERIVLKAYAAMGGLHAGLDALFTLNQQRPLRADQIEQIDIDLSHAVYHHGWWELQRPITPIAAQMNIAYSIAVAILDGEAMVQQYSPQRIDRDDVWALIPKIKAHHDAEFDKGGALGRGRTRLRIRLRDGSELQAEQLAPQSALQALSREQVVSKYRRLTDGLLPAARQAQIEALVLTLEQQPDVSALSALLALPVDAAFN